MSIVFQKRLSELAREYPIIHDAPQDDPVISSIAYDSRQAAPGSLFVPLSGVHTDGRRFIADAVARGASAILHETGIPAGSSVPVVLAGDARAAMSALSARLYDNPSEKLFVIGVTGTDGKSSTVWFIHQFLELLGLASGFLSTAACQTGDAVTDNPFRQSTPESPEIHRLLAEMVCNKKEFAVIETTSHGLSDRTMRLADVRFDAAVFTNIAHEHLEFHGTPQQYMYDKANLFRMTGKGKKAGKPRPFGVVNLDSPHWEYFAKASGTPVLTFMMESGRDARDLSADLAARSVSSDLSGSTFALVWQGTTIPGRISLPGNFNVENALAALLTVHAATGRPLPEIAALLPRLMGVRGRMERVDLRQAFNVFVDFAHTPQAFEKILPMMRDATRGRLIAVFGSAGERDTAKRPMQGRAASGACDILILSDEDPRGEDRMNILREIAAGCEGKNEGRDLYLIPDRREAIRFAFSLAQPGDTVLLLGKGHEKSIIQQDGPVSWNERAVAEELLGEMAR